jgi:hypothetical protein
MENDDADADAVAKTMIDAMLDLIANGRHALLAWFGYVDSTPFPLVDKRKLHWMLYDDESLLVYSKKPLTFEAIAPGTRGVVRFASLFQTSSPHRKRVNRTPTHAMLVMIDVPGNPQDIVLGIFDAALECTDEALRKQIEDDNRDDDD